MKGYAHLVREDLVNPGLLFVGTEMGPLGEHRRRGQGADDGGLPESVAVLTSRSPSRPRPDHATHGRGSYIIDDITPLAA